jgi:hypothetical protein
MTCSISPSTLPGATAADPNKYRCGALSAVLTTLCSTSLPLYAQISLSVGTSRGRSSRLYRSLDHGTAKRLFERNRNQQVLGPAIAAIGAHFNVLQEERHTADYNPEPFRLGRKETLQLVDETRQAVLSLRSLPKDLKLSLAVLLIAKQR